MQTYVPVISPRLTEFLSDNTEFAAQCQNEIEQSAKNHAGMNNLTVCVDDEPLRQLDCVGIAANTDEVKHATADQIASQLRDIFPIASQVIGQYASNPSMLEGFKRLVDDKERITIAYDHRGLVTATLASACLLYVLYDEGIVSPGDVDMGVILGTTTKYLDYYGSPIAKGLVESGAFQFIDYVVPRALSTEQRPALQLLQEKFNPASMRARLERQKRNKDRMTFDIICASGSTDKLFGQDYHMAPAGDSASLFKRGFRLPMGIGEEPDGAAAVYIGSFMPPINRVEEVDEMMEMISKGMGKVSTLPSIYHRDPEEYGEFVLNQAAA